ncbi:hypothetical protein GCM10025777_00680 [Membranihabitans marinus]
MTKGDWPRSVNSIGGEESSIDNTCRSGLQLWLKTKKQYEEIKKNKDLGFMDIIDFRSITKLVNLLVIN